MRTKKEIEKVYREQLSMNRLTDKWILKAREEIGSLAVSTDIKMDIKTVVDYAHDIELTSLAAASLGRRGGSSKSEKKQTASRENGKKGGRPKTKTWFVANHKGDLAGHDMSKTHALMLAAEMKEKEPDAEWEAIQGE